MSDQPIFVHVDLDGATRLVGRLWARQRNGKESASFEYDEAWLANAARFALEPALSLGRGPYHTAAGRRIFGAIGDSAPDRWGRVLIQRDERRRAREAKRSARTLSEIDYLLQVGDVARQGALRFSQTDRAPFLAPGVQIPPLIQLPALLGAAMRTTAGADSDDDLRLLLAPGSSLGGARPKASVVDRDGQLCIAKFPHHDDVIRATAWEALTLSLAARAGVSTPEWRIENVGDREVLLLRRFDRSGAARIPFLSAMSMLDAADNEPHSYLEIADSLRRHGAAPREDCAQLWRRIVFSILVSNTDDHLRNHGFLHEAGAGWRLSPAYDLNPVPVDIKPRVLTTAIDEADSAASLDLAYTVISSFGLRAPQAREIVREVGKAVAGWRKAARALKLSNAETERMASAFEHGELKSACK